MKKKGIGMSLFMFRLEILSIMIAEQFLLPSIVLNLLDILPT